METAAILIILIFGFHFRLGITVLLAVLIGSAVTSTLKNVFEYPRPVFLSSDVGEPGDPSPPPTIYDGGGGSRFWSFDPYIYRVTKVFQTELNAWLQSYSTPWLDFIMRSVSFVGHGEITFVNLNIIFSANQ